MLAIDGLAALVDNAPVGGPITLSVSGTDATNNLSVVLRDAPSVGVVATLTGQWGGTTVTRTVWNFSDSITFVGSNDADGSIRNSVVLSTPYGLALDEGASQLHWDSMCDFTPAVLTDVSVDLQFADKLTVTTPGTVAGAAPSSIDGTFASPTTTGLNPLTNPGSDISFISNSSVKLGATSPVKAYNLSITGSNNGAISTIVLDGAVTVTNALSLTDANAIVVDEDVDSTGGSISIASTTGAVSVTAGVLAPNGSVSIEGSAGVDLSAGTASVNAGGSDGTLRLVSTLGSVLLTPTALTADGDITIQAGLDLNVNRNVTSGAGDVVLGSFNGEVNVLAAVTATAGSVLINAYDDVDLALATVLTAGGAGGSISLTSAEGSVILTPFALTTDGDITVRSALNLSVNRDITSTSGYVDMRSALGTLTLTKSVTAAAGSVWLESAGNLDVSGATGLAVSGAGGALTLISTQGQVLLRPVSLTVSGDILVRAAADLDIVEDVTSAAGNVTLRSTGGNVAVDGVAVEATLGNVRLEAAGSLDLSTTTALKTGPGSGDLTLIATQGQVLFNTATPLPVVAAGDVAVTAGQDLVIGVNVTSTAGTVTLTSTGGAIAFSKVVSVPQGNLTLSAAGNIDDGATGTVLAATGISTFTAGVPGTPRNIILNNGLNDFGDVRVVRGQDVTLNDVGALGFGGASTISGNLVVTANGTISDGATGTLAVTGSTSLTTTGSTSDIVVDNANSFVGDVTVVASRDVTLNNAGNLQFGGSSTIVRNLVATAGGSIADGAAGTLLVNGTTRLAATGGASDVALDNANNFVGDVTITAGRDALLNDINAIQFGLASKIDRDLTVSAAGSITDATGSVLAVAGLTTLATTGMASDIVLDGANGLVGDVTILASRDATLNNTVALQFGGVTSVVGDLVVTAGGAISDGAAGTLLISGTAVLTATGATGDVLLDNANDFIGDVTVVASRDVTLSDVSSIQFGGVSIIQGNLVVTAGNTVTDGAAGSLQVKGTSVLVATNAVGDVLLDNLSNRFEGTVTVTAGRDATLGNSIGIEFGGASAVGRDLAVSASGTITDGTAATLSVGRTSTFTTTGATSDVTLDNGHQFFGSVTVQSGRDTTISAIDSLLFGGASTIGRNLVVTAGDSITDGAAGTIAVGGATSLTATAAISDILLDNANDFTGDVTVLAGRDVSLQDINTLRFGGVSQIGRNLSVTAVGSITDGAVGTLEVTGTTTLAATGPAGDVILDNGNEFVGDVTLTVVRDATLRDVTSIQFGGSSTVGRNLSVTAVAGSITDGGAGSLFVTGTTRLSALDAAGDIELDNVVNDFVGNVTVNAGRDVSLTDINAIQFGGLSTVGRNLVVIAGGSITDSAGGLLVVTGTTSLTANGPTSDIILDNQHDFIGDVTVAGDRDVTLRDVNSLQFGGASTIGQDLVVIAAGNITDGASGTLAVVGTTTLTAGGNITLDNDGHDFGGDVTLNSDGDVTLGDGNDVTVTGPSVVLGDFNLTAGNSVTVRNLTVTGDVTILATTGTLTASSIVSTVGDIDFQSPLGDIAVIGQLSAQAGNIDLTAWSEVRGAASLTPISAQIVAQVLAVTARDGDGVGAKIQFTNRNNLVDQVQLDLVTDAGVATGTGVSYVDADAFTVTSVICALGTVTLESVGGGISVNGGIGSGNGETLSGVTLTAIDAIAVTGTVRAGAGAVSIDSSLGDVQVTGSLESSPTAAVSIDAGDSITIAGNIAAGTGITLDAIDAISVTGSLTAAVGDVSIESLLGNVQTSGTISSSPVHAVTVEAGDSITISGTLLSGLTATITAGNRVSLGEATASTSISSILSDVVVDAVGAITVTRGDVSAPLGSIRMTTPDTLSFDDGSLVANLDYVNGANKIPPSPVIGLVRLDAPNGISVVNSPLVRTGRLEMVGGGGGGITLTDTLNEVDTIQVETGGDFTFYQALVPLAIDDPDDVNNATIQVMSVGGAVSITSLAGLRVVDGIVYNTKLSLIGRETGADPGVEFVVTAPTDNPSPPAAPHPLSFAGTLRDMLNYVNANTASSISGTGNAAMRVVFDDTRAPTVVTLASTLPQIVKTITFDGIRLDGARVELDGSAIIAPTANGLSLGAGSTGSVVQNAYVYGFTGAAVAATSARNVFRGLTLGEDSDPVTEPLGNGIGILLTGTQAVQNVVGIQNAGDVGNEFVGNVTGLVISGGANYTTVRGNGIYQSVRDGISMTQSIGAIIGSDANPLLGNEIFGNGRHGIYLENVQGSSVAYGATIQGNTIGGHLAGSGIRVAGGGRSMIGGTITGAANLISGNVDGVRIESSLLPTPANNVQLYGNTITDNTAAGIHVQSGFANIVSGNTIGTNGEAGVRIVGATATKDQVSNVVVSNTVTSNGNAENNGGIVVQNSRGQVIGVDGRGRVLGNIVTGNGGSGIAVVGNSLHSQNSVVGNTVTTSKFDGIRVAGAVGTLVRGNTVTGNTRAGVVVADAQSSATTGNLVQRNVVSGNAVGIRVAGSRSTTVGGILLGDANFVHSNNTDGIRVESSTSAGPSQGTLLRNNVVGVTPGSEPAGNTGYGIRISEATGTTVDYANVVRNNLGGGIIVTGGNATMIGSGVPGRANVIAANTGAGIRVEQSARVAQQQVNVTVAGNRIESNTGDGIVVTGSRASAVTIGRAPSITVPNGTGNTISDNAGAGIRVNAARNVTMIGNSIYDNDAAPIVLENGGNGGVVPPTPIGVAMRRGNVRDPQWEIRGVVPGAATQRFYVDIYMDVIGGGQVFMGRVLVQGGKQFRVILKGPANGLGASGIRATSTASSGGVMGSTSAFSAAWG